MAMLKHRKLMLILVLLLVGGSIASSLGYAVYLRSDGYRRSIEDEVSGYLKLPVSVGAITPLSIHGRRFDEVSVYLADNTERIFHCAESFWRRQQIGDVQRYVLEIQDGWFLIGTGRFSRGDYKKMLHGGLGHDFTELNLQAVFLQNMDIVWRQADFELSVDAAAGEVVFDYSGDGKANLSARTLNGIRVPEPINIRAIFTPGRSIEFHHIALDVPRIPLSALGLDRSLNTTVTDGSFDGTVTFRQSGNGPVLTLRGAVRDARLEELTGQLPMGAIRGVANIDVGEAVMTHDRLVSLSFSGDLSGVYLRDLAPFLKQPDLEGKINLSVEQARYGENELEYLSASADAADVSMAAITRLIGKGVITGQLRVTVNALLVVDNTIRWADIDLDVIPPPDGSGAIDRDMILYVGGQILGVDLGSAKKFLPEKVEYAKLGCKIEIDRDQLRVKGSHGTDGRTILTVRVFDQELGIVREPSRTFPLTDLLASLKERVFEYDVDTVRNWWEHSKEEK